MSFIWKRNSRSAASPRCTLMLKELMEMERERGSMVETSRRRREICFSILSVTICGASSASSMSKRRCKLPAFETALPRMTNFAVLVCQCEFLETSLRGMMRYFRESYCSFLDLNEIWGFVNAIRKFSHCNSDFNSRKNCNENSYEN